MSEENKMPAEAGGAGAGPGNRTSPITWKKREDVVRLGKLLCVEECFDEECEEWGNCGHEIWSPSMVGWKNCALICLQDGEQAGVAVRFYDESKDEVESNTLTVYKRQGDDIYYSIYDPKILSDVVEMIKALAAEGVRKEIIEMWMRPWTARSNVLQLDNILSQ